MIFGCALSNLDAQRAVDSERKQYLDIGCLKLSEKKLYELLKCDPLI
jgi:hypothetical protein